MYRKALKIQRTTLGPKHPSTLTSMSNLAQLLHAQPSAELKEAEPLMRETLEILRATLCPKHPSTLASMSNFAALLKDQGKLGETEPLMRETQRGQPRNSWSQTLKHTYKHEQLGSAAAGSGQAGRGRAIV